MRKYYVYFMANKYNTVLYVGVTSNLQQRILQHKNGVSNFTRRYNVTKIIYWEEFSDIRIAIEREKQIKSWSRERKEQLINAVNPKWQDLTLINKEINNNMSLRGGPKVRRGNPPR